MGSSRDGGQPFPEPCEGPCSVLKETSSFSYGSVPVGTSQPRGQWFQKRVEASGREMFWGLICRVKQIQVIKLCPQRLLGFLLLCCAKQPGIRWQGKGEAVAGKDASQ